MDIIRPYLTKPTNPLYLSAVLSGVTVFLSFPSFNVHLLIWIAFVPLLAALRGKTPLQAFYAGTLCLFTVMCGGFYWIEYLARHYIGLPVPFNYLAVVVYALFIGLLGGLIFYVNQLISKYAGVWRSLVLPVVFVSFWSIYPMLFYFRLGESQFYVTQIIQPIEFTGVYGLDFVIVLSNTVITEVIFNGKKSLNKIGNAVGLGIIASWVISGFWLYSHWGNGLTAAETVKIAAVQPNHPINSGLGPLADPIELEMSTSAAAQGATVIIWPEGRFLGFDYYPQIKNAFTRFAEENKALLIINDRSKAEKEYDGYVSTFAIMPDSPSEKYDKNILVPFGETMLFEGWLRPIVRQYGIPVPNFKPGNDYRHFAFEGRRFTPLICYENLFPEYAAGAIGTDGTGKVFVFQSQDGWYGSAAQAENHLTISLMRAVENRVPAVHVINNGASAAVNARGDMIARSAYGSQALMVFDLPAPPTLGGSFYSRNPLFFVTLVQIIAVCMGISAFIAKKNRQPDTL